MDTLIAHIDSFREYCRERYETIATVILALVTGAFIVISAM
jgi:hypothetical protein